MNKEGIEKRVNACLSGFEAIRISSIMKGDYDKMLLRKIARQMKYSLSKDQIVYFISLLECEKRTTVNL